MRNILIAVATVAGLGLLGTSGALAAPASGTAIRDAASSSTTVQDVRFCRKRCWHGGMSHRECKKECRDMRW